MFQESKNQFTQFTSHKPCIDRNQATAHLEALGYQPGNAVYIRAFLSKEDLRYAPNTGRKADRLNWEQIERWQAQGYGVYIVVNGGGHKDEDVKSCRAIFCEFDDRPIEEQIWFWRELGLPEPSLQVQTRKSVHTYWVFDEAIEVDAWRKLQTDLLVRTGSDPALKNPSRVMRLAGSYHIKPGCKPVYCNIIHNLDKHYSYQELRAAIPLPKPPDPKLPLLQPSYESKPQGKRYEDIRIPVIELVSLEACLSKKSRLLLESGVGEGSRNVSGAKLARDLIGTATYLQAIGQHFDGNPQQMLEDYANRCTPPLPASEVDAIWNSAEKDRPGPSCQPEGVEACVRAWYWKHHVKPNQQQQATEKSNSQVSGRGFGNGNSGSGGATPPVAAVTLCDRISEILSRHESESEVASTLMDLATATGRTYNEINSLAKIIRAEGELATEVIAAVNSFQGILKSCRKRLDIRRYLDKGLSDPLLSMAAAMPTAPEYLFNTLLASSASRIGTAARVIINPEGGYTQPCIFWTANVAHSGQAKTPPQQAILKPLEEMEAAAKEIHNIQVEDYENDNDSDRKPPVRQRRLLNNVTTSTKIRIHDENPRGLLEYLDELVADYQRLNQFKNGKGDDLQLELSFWNGSGGNFDRHDARLFLERVALSKTGTYQWDTLARLMADEVNFIASGYSSRFLYCSILDAPARYLDLLSSRSANTLKEKLCWLYGELEKLPQADYLLSHEAKVLFQAWNHTLVNAEIEEVHFGLSLVYAKIESYTARIALWLHLVNAVLRGDAPLPVISGETMQHAIEIASFYLWQHKLIHAHNAPNRQLEGLFLKVQTQAEKFFTKCSKGVGASFLKTRINALKSWAVEKIRSSIFKTLAAAGHGRVEGEGSEMVYIPNTMSDASGAQLVDVGGKLVASPIDENHIITILQAPIGEFGEQATSIITSKEPDEAITSSSFANASSSHHQFTNLNAQSIADTCFLVVDDTIKSSPFAPTATEKSQHSSTAQELAEQILLCQTWVELARLVEHNQSKLLPATRQMSREQRQGLSTLLAKHLCSYPADLSQLTWLPKKLLDRALEKLTFTIQQIGDVASNVLNPSREYIASCKFVNVNQVGTRHERWIFQCPNGNRIYILGTEAIKEIALN